MRVRVGCVLQGEIIDPKGHPARIDAATLQLGIRVTVRLHHSSLSQRRHCARARLARQVGRTTAAATASTAPTTTDFQAVRASLAPLQRIRVLRHSLACGRIVHCWADLTDAVCSDGSQSSLLQVRITAAKQTIRRKPAAHRSPALSRCAVLCSLPIHSAGAPWRMSSITLPLHLPLSRPLEHCRTARFTHSAKRDARTALGCHAW